MKKNFKRRKIIIIMIILIILKRRNIKKGRKSQKYSHDYDKIFSPLSSVNMLSHLKKRLPTRNVEGKEKDVQ